MGVSAQSQAEDYTGTIISRGGAEHEFVSLWSYASGVRLPYWSTVKEFCDSRSWGEGALLPFSDIRRIDFEQPMKDEVAMIRSCKKDKTDYGANPDYYDPAKATLTMRTGQKRTVFLYGSAFVKVRGEELQWFLGDTLRIASLIFRTPK
jgi:hypothetical protein